MEDRVCISSLTQAPTASISCSRVRAATCTPGGAPAEPGIEFSEADWELPSISSTPSGSSSYGRPPPGLATVGGATTTSLRILRYDKKVS